MRGESVLSCRWIVLLRSRVVLLRVSAQALFVVIARKDSRYSISGIVALISFHFNFDVNG
jgi:hypothetical protein